MRKLLRNIARENMRKMGIEKINKKKPTVDKKGNRIYKSLFSEHWRSCAHFMPELHTRKKQRGGVIVGRKQRKGALKIVG